jgi:Leucine-rich repeat (LRR) protein
MKRQNMAPDVAYFEAEQKIAAARRSRATELNLSRNYDQNSESLIELPDSLWELTALQSLNISYNQLTALPEAIGQLTQLQSLDISYNQLTALPAAIGQLTQLRSLDISDNQLTALPEAIGQLTQLRSLYISYNQLTALPEVIGELSLLQSLNISNNQLAALPAAISQLLLLQWLDVSHNQLTALPKAIGQLTQLQSLDISDNQLTALPETIGQLTRLRALKLLENKVKILPRTIGNLEHLQELYLSVNPLVSLPESMKKLTQLRAFGISSTSLGSLPDWLGNFTELAMLGLASNGLSGLPEWMRNFTKLRFLSLGNYESSGHYPGYIFGYGHTFDKGNNLTELPDWVGDFTQLEQLDVRHNHLSDLPDSFTKLERLKHLYLTDNPLNPELAVAYEQGLEAVKAYLRAKAESKIVLNEAKLILVGEGEVGKTSLLAALRGDPFVEKRPTTHGVEVDIKSLVVQDSDGREIILNGWDFGGQHIYRHTHQLFFTAPAVYLAVWEPRRGPEQCRVAEWIKIIRHRAYDETRPDERPRILIVATHGGPTERLAHIDEQALRDEFGDLIAGFYHVDSKPNHDGVCYGVDELKAAIGREAAAIPSVRRTVPLSWKKVLEAIAGRSKEAPYIHYEDFEKLCAEQGVTQELAATYALIFNELGHLIYYGGDETLKDTVILKADYLSKAVSFVLEDKATKDAHGLVEHGRLYLLWNNPHRPTNERYPPALHPVFLRLMTKFDLSYQVVMPQADAPDTSLMAQLVPGVRPEGWEDDWTLKPGDVERAQVCRVLDAVTGRTVEAEGLIYRLIVRLHRYSLGRKNYHDSRHWKTGMILDDGYNGRAFIEEIGGDVYVTVRAAYPERFLAHLCAEVQWLVEHFWKGLNARLYVPCPTDTCKGLLELDEMMAFKSAEMPKVRCAVCRQFHEIDSLMTTMQPKSAWSDALAKLRDGQQQILQAQQIGVEQLSTQLRVLMSQADEQYVNLLAWLSDPAKEGPRLFSFEPVHHSKFNPRSWTRESFHLTLWCEHSQKPVPYLNGPGSRKGVIQIELTREWFKRAAPVLKVLTGTLSLILPVASSGLKLAVDETGLKAMEKQLDFGQEIIDASLSGAEKSVDWLDGADEAEFKRGELIRARGSVLYELHALLKVKDPSFGGLVRVQNKRREFLWVHERFVSEYC